MRRRYDEINVPAKAALFGRGKYREENTELARDGECNHGQMVLLMFHRCTAQEVTPYLEECDEMRIDWDLRQVLVRFIEPWRSSTALELIVLA